MNTRLDDFSQLLLQTGVEAVSGSFCAPLIREEQPALNGVPYRLFRQSEALLKRRREGTFFSGPVLAAELAQLIRGRLANDALVMDPTCGMGDLLIAYARELPLQPTLADTLEHWGQKVSGTELRHDLVEMTKARLIMLARARGGFSAQIENLGSTFPLITVGDMFKRADMIERADGFLFNPPFVQTSTHSLTTWGSGRLNAAALCLDSLVAQKRPSAPIAAVLPEVLRCGTRYGRFRERLSDAGCGGDFRSVGRFDAWTDVDVFTTLLHQTTLGIWQTKRSEVARCLRISDLFDVRVGTVVPHRHAAFGPWSAYACAKTVPAWARSYVPGISRRFKGTTFKPPFVVVRRTSSPSDKKRAVGAIITGDKSVAVENHLIVLIPRSNRMEECLELLDFLSKDEVSDHLNREIRCRHLTTASVSSIPWKLKSG